MAKRRKLEAPSAEELSRFEEEFRRETAPRSTSAPIAQVAAESAAAMDLRPASQRAEAARDSLDAATLRQAQAQGLVMLDLSLEQIEADALVRDRVALDPEEMAELQASIQRSGLRLPLEVFALPDGGYGLLSGYRRLMACRALHALHPEGGFGHVKAVLRDPAGMGGAFAAMVEENEVRAALSQFERGRIAVVTAQQGAFATVDAAVDALFPVASKAKRSKIRSFALIFEQLGDMLAFPGALREKDGLALAMALRAGAGPRLRAALADAMPTSAQAEMETLSRAMAGQGATGDPARGGRPAHEKGSRRALAGGVVLQSRADAKGWQIHLAGPGIDRDLVERAMLTLEQLLTGKGA